MSDTSRHLTEAELRAIEKEIASIDRALAKLSDRISAKHDEMAAHDQSDHNWLGRLTAELRDLESQVTEHESRWMELSERLEDA